MKKIIVILSITGMFFINSCQVTRPISATSNPVGNKVGKSSVTGILWYPPFYGVGTSSIQEAAKNGGITKISTVDFTINFFFLWNERICTVTGE